MIEERHCERSEAIHVSANPESMASLRSHDGLECEDGYPTIKP